MKPKRWTKRKTKKRIRNNWARQRADKQLLICLKNNPSRGNLGRLTAPGIQPWSMMISRTTKTPILVGRSTRTATPEIGLFVSDTELQRRLGVGPKTGRIAVQTLELSGFPPKQPPIGNKRYWPAVRFFLDRYYGLIDGRAAVPAATDRRRASQDCGR